MKLVTFSVYSESRLGVWTDRGIVDLRMACSTYSQDSLTFLFSDARTFLEAGDMAFKLAGELVASVEKHERADTSNLAKPQPLLSADKVVLKAPILNPQKIYCPSVNYPSHGKEVGVEPPKEPYLFTKYLNAIVGPEDNVIASRLSQKVDFEVELAAVIGKRGRFIPEGEAYKYIAGYTVLNDISFRDLQVQPGWPKVLSPFGQNFIKGKGLDTSCPIGPCIVTSDELPLPYPLALSARVNGAKKQEGNTNDMLFKVSELVSYISRGITLDPGDIIATGTPNRVPGAERVYLKPGDVVEAEIEKIGVLRNHVIRDSDSAVV